MCKNKKKRILIIKKEEEYRLDYVTVVKDHLSAIKDQVISLIQNRPVALNDCNSNCFSHTAKFLADWTLDCKTSNHYSILIAYSLITSTTDSKLLCNILNITCQKGNKCLQL